MRARRASGSSGNVLAISVATLVVDHQRRQVRLGKVAVVVRLLFRTHAVGVALVGVVEARFLRDLAAGSISSICARFRTPSAARMKRKLFTFFDFGFGAELLLASRPHAHIGIAAQRALFHVAVGDAGVEQDFLESREVFEGFVGGADVGLADDLDQRRAAAVQVEIRARV